MTDVPVNPRRNRLGSKKCGLTEVEAAKRLGVTEKELAALEAATALPVTRLRQIASKYAVTFASLLMPGPLPESTRIQLKDFRTHGGHAARLDYDLLIQMDDLNAQIDLLVEIRESDPQLFESAPLPRAILNSDVEQLAYDARTQVNVPTVEQVAWDKDTFAFRRWRAVLEALGVFVYSLDLRPQRRAEVFLFLTNGECRLP